MACDMLGVSTSGYFEHWRRKEAYKPSKAGANKRNSIEALLAHIRAIHAEVKRKRLVRLQSSTTSPCWWR